MSDKSILDIVEWFYSEKGVVDSFKLNILCYYAEAWSLVKLGRSISGGTDFVAGVFGPDNGIIDCVVSEGLLDGLKSFSFSNEELSLLEDVWDTYGDLENSYLQELVHGEEPWLEARGSRGIFEECFVTINKDTMVRYYSSIAL